MMIAFYRLIVSTPWFILSATYIHHILVFGNLWDSFCQADLATLLVTKYDHERSVETQCRHMNMPSVNSDPSQLSTCDRITRDVEAKSEFTLPPVHTIMPLKGFVCYLP